MDRKHFLSSSASLFAASVLPASAMKPADQPASVIPPYLKKGDLIGITSPAGYITHAEVLPAVRLMESWGYRIRLGKTIGRRDATFGGTDMERLSDMQQMLNDREIKAIMCARGGYGSVRIVDHLKWEQFRAHPKWMIGFSDITVLHSHIQRNLGIASIHSKMCNSFPDIWEKADSVQKETIGSIRKALSGEGMDYSVVPNAHNREGTATGILTGGNLKTLETLAGSDSDLRTENKILFVEDTGEYLYSIDRMFWNLQRTGKLRNLAGLIIGGFKIKQDDPGEEFGKDLQQIVMEKVKNYRYPVCFDFPVGHQRDNFALKCGIPHKLIVQTGACTLTDKI
ncbi:LD-carboxypeptidase [Terrimonas sp. NA20]|uniref:LD-carboxypeptidase n=1 Tax=Terrimonas ginsenosidimutans TaxID=2908004 RepID=A0ABS9KVZ4_9BACT|nr:LD-carboxypeptidase [Terrimonas ginsenosidimutans]MCG2616506.1 LD-carboxypeptidase [Terrimonas ginsenosidimutans]